jgi:hypothetical protein
MLGDGLKFSGGIAAGLGEVPEREDGIRDWCDEVIFGEALEHGLGDEEGDAASVCYGGGSSTGGG